MSLKTRLANLEKRVGGSKIVNPIWLLWRWGEGLFLGKKNDAEHIIDAFSKDDPDLDEKVQAWRDQRQKRLDEVATTMAMYED